MVSEPTPSPCMTTLDGSYCRLVDRLSITCQSKSCRLVSKRGSIKVHVINPAPHSQCLASRLSVRRFFAFRSDLLRVYTLHLFYIDNRYRCAPWGARGAGGAGTSAVRGPYITLRRWSTWNWRKSGNLSQFFPDTAVRRDCRREHVRPPQIGLRQDLEMARADVLTKSFCRNMFALKNRLSHQVDADGEHRRSVCRWEHF